MTRPMLAAALLLAACGEAEKAPATDQPAQQAVQQQDETPEPVTPQQVDLTGRWAVSERMCRIGWWDFGQTEIRTAGELRCTVDDQERTLHRIRLELTCIGEGLPSVETWNVRILDGERLSVTRDAAPAILLTRCRAA